MQNTKSTETASKIVFKSKIEVLVAGGTVAVGDLTQTVLSAGTPVGKDTNGLYHVVKVAQSQANATNSATSYRVLKGHNFKVGNIFTTGLLKPAYPITAIDTSNASYDTITVSTTLGVAITAANNDMFIEATAEASGNTSAWKYTPVGFVGFDAEIKAGDNLMVQIVVRGTINTSVAPPLHADLKTALPLFRYV